MKDPHALALLHDFLDSIIDHPLPRFGLSESEAKDMACDPLTMPIVAYVGKKEIGAAHVIVPDDDETAWYVVIGESLVHLYYAGHLTPPTHMRIGVEEFYRTDFTEALDALVYDRIEKMQHRDDLSEDQFNDWATDIEKARLIQLDLTRKKPPRPKSPLAP